MRPAGPGTGKMTSLLHAWKVLALAVGRWARVWKVVIPYVIVPYFNPSYVDSASAVCKLLEQLKPI